MALDPAPIVLGPAVAPQVEPTLADDGARLRQTAQRQWAARRDLERRLHDGAALRVSALTLRLGLLRHRHPDDEQEFQAAVEELQHELHLVLQELRDIAGRLYPPLLDEAGLGPALREAVGRGTAPVRIEAPDERFGPDVEGAVYFAVLGCLPEESVVARRDRRAARGRRRRRARLAASRPARLSSPTASGCWAAPSRSVPRPVPERSIRL